MRIMTLLSFVLLGLSACGGSGAGVAGKCTSNGDCSSGLTCNTSIAGGYCTQTCPTTGVTTGCPSGSVCDQIGGSAMLACEQICTKQSDCRTGLECDGVSGSGAKACKIKGADIDGGTPDAATTHDAGL
jgi:hypothetical protein